MDARSGASGNGATRATLTRRGLLAGAGATLAAGVAGTAAGQQGGGMAQVPDYGGWFGADASRGPETGSFSGTVDRRGEDAVTVEVGAQGNGGPFAFAPTAVWVDPGTTVTFEWVSDTHNLVVDRQPDGAGWAGHQTVEDSGFSFEHTFEADGVYAFFCQPHLALGMKGAIAVGEDVPLTSPGGAGGGGITFPGGDLGVAFMGLLLGTAGLASVFVLGDELHRAVTRDADGPTSAHTTALVAAAVGLLALLVVVARLLLG